ncbi:hypothetical protein [Hydrogenophaga palleronii]|uniref:hypothetical protein n=1 Tax=Hydrogenophaga palleronii TaxID=65655 RepID=UPI000B30CA79|nr:hypothetical protein [Hydrogenophaga palleronii]
MGRTYSVNGYLNAALRRSGKTLLVEGPGDKALLHRLIAERLPNFSPLSNIDHAGMVEDPLLAGSGNKSRVVTVRDSVDILASHSPKIASKLGTLTDREWDGLAIDDYSPQPEWHPPVQCERHFTTLGHSIENYNFDYGCIKEYIKFHFAEFATENVFVALEKGIPATLVLAAVLSIKLKNESQLSRSNGLIDLPHIREGNERIYLDASFSAACTTRGISCAETIVLDVNQGVDAAWEALHRSHSTKWIPHGHIGNDVLWVGAAYIALRNGFPRELAAELAKGGRKQRDLFQAQWLSKEPASKREPLDATLDWLNQAA